MKFFSFDFKEYKKRRTQTKVAHTQFKQPIMKMRFFLIVCNISVLLFAKIISGSVINRYPRSNIVNDDNDPGDALYVTKFIESGDIETVCFYFSDFLIKSTAIK